LLRRPSHSSVFDRPRRRLAIVAGAFGANAGGFCADSWPPGFAARFARPKALFMNLRLLARSAEEI